MIQRDVSWALNQASKQASTIQRNTALGAHQKHVAARLRSPKALAALLGQGHQPSTSADFAELWVLVAQLLYPPCCLCKRHSQCQLGSALARLPTCSKPNCPSTL